jgi:aminoacrylate hydrolase
MPQFQNGPARVHYEIAGEGPPLLLIAGTASDNASWGPLLPRLDGRQLIMIDNRGSGRTKVEGPIEITEMADDCAALLAHLGLDAVDVVGHSLGGFIGLLLAVRHPTQVRRLVTMGSGGFGRKEAVLFHDMARLYFTMVPDDWFRLLYQWLFSEPFFADEANVAAAAAGSTAYAYRQSPGDFARQVAALDRTGPLDLSDLTCPILAISAELDQLAPEPAVHALHASAPNVRYATIAGAAHSVHWEQADTVANAILGFLG